jgi:transcriptional regulator with XRE-family HTH domain
VIGVTLQKLRNDLGVSVVDVARELEMSDRFVSIFEAGRINPNPGMVQRITKAIIAAHKEKAPGTSAVRAADQEPSQTETNRQEGTNPMSIIMHQTPDSDQTLVVVPCEHPGCDQYETGHEVAPIDRDAFMHMHAGPWTQAPGSVDCYFDTELGRWHAGAAIDDGDGALTCEEIHAFTAAWDQAYATAQELNAAEVPC